MSSKKMTGILEQLQAEATCLEAEASKHSEQLKLIERQLAQIRKASRSLGEAEEKGQSPEKSTASKDEVYGLITKVLRQEGKLPVDQLRVRMEETLSRLGKARTGFSMRFQSAIKDSRFEVVEGVVRLNAERKEGTANSGDVQGRDSSPVSRVS